MPQWTNAQREAIELRKRNLLVSAAAGSGKTAVLVERIIRLITEDLIDINKLLIVTFTNAAAGEMRERILNALTEEIEKRTDKEEHLRRQIGLLNRSYIMTLHSFCIDVVRRNFHHIDIDPTFRIGDSTEISIMIEEVLEELLEEEYEKGHGEFINLVEGFGGNREDIKLQELIYKIYTFIQSKPNPQEWLWDQVEAFNLSKDEMENSKWMETIKESIDLELQGCRDLISEAMELCRNPNGPIEYKDALEGDLKNIEQLMEALETSLDEFYIRIDSIKHPKLKSIKKDRKLEINSSIQDEVKELRKKYKDSLTNSIKNKILTQSFDDFLKQLNMMYPTMGYLYKLIQRFTELYKERKLERGILDFSDLEHFALRILGDEEVRQDYKNRFEHIFVDEYQDSNIVQETILNLIKRKDNLFLVGDVKQSIYRFRLADPTLFIDKYETYSIEGDGINRRIDLSQNFRTRGEILEGINLIFKNIMTRTLGEIEYDEAAYLYKGLDFKEVEDSSIELNIVENSSKDIEELDEELENMSNAELEARLAVKRINSLIGKKHYSAKEGEYKEIKYRDIVILLRSPRNWAPVFSEIFTREGIPVYSDDTSGYFDTIEINMFLDLLKVIDNKRQDIPLLSVMRSPIGSFTTEELIEIRINNKEGCYYDSLESYIENNDNRLKNKLASFLDRLNRWSREGRMMKLDEFIWKLLIETGYYHYVGAMPGGLQRQANLRIFVDRASAFEKSAINGLFLFLRFIDKLTKSRGDMGSAKTLSESENVVRIMSIHKSKGLEFPVVICCGMGKQFNLMDTRDDILIHKDLGLGPKFIEVDKRIYSQTLPQIAIKRKIKIENLSEEMRILYVALTRAIDKLILVGTVRNIENEAKKWNRGISLYNLSKGKNYLDWICSVLSRHLEIFTESKENENKEIGWKINILDKLSLMTEENQKLENQRSIKEELEKCDLDGAPQYKAEINRRFNWEYRHKEAIKIPSKLAVSDIKKASASNIENIAYKIPSLIKSPKFIEGKKPFAKAEIGTIIHFVMQHLDLKRAFTQESIEKQLEEMILRELLTEEEAKVVDINKILNFFKGELGKRILVAPEVLREIPFVLKKKAVDVIEGLQDCDEEVLIQGIIDCYFEEGENIVLIDYKTGEITSSRSLEDVIGRYKIQIDLYKEALEEITQKKVIESYIYLFDIDKGVKL